MEQTERITMMERCLNRASQAVIKLSAAFDEYEAAQKAGIMGSVLLIMYLSFIYKKSDHYGQQSIYKNNQ